MRERQELRCKVPPCFRNALAIASFTLGATSFAAQSAAGREHQFACAKPQCIVVHVDGISRDSESVVYGTQPPAAVDSTTTNVRVSDSQNTYQLTCNRENKTCIAPAPGTEYQLVAIQEEKPEDLDDHEGEYPHRGKAAYLKNANVTLGPYWMVAEMPRVGISAFQKLIEKCNAQGLNENDCTKWLTRRARMREAGCPDSGAPVACHSFQQLLGAADPDIMDLFGRLEHVYVCSHSQEDVFLTLWFPEPSEWHWSKANAEEQKVFGLQSGTLMQITGPGVSYYNKGVKDENAHISEIGVWSYLPLTSDITPSSLARLATSNDAKFNGKTFQIDGTRIAVSESYKNSNGKEIKHTLVVQRSTGRFAEAYAEDASGHTVLSYSGKCLVVPNATD